MVEFDNRIVLGVDSKENTRQRILNAATENFSEKGYHGAAVDDLIKSSYTSKGSFYFHFSSKQEIFFSLVDKFIASLSNSTEESIRNEKGAFAKINAALETVFKTLSRHRSSAKILLVGGVGFGKAFDERLLSGHAKLALLIKGYLDEAVASGAIRLIDTATTAYAWLGAIKEVIIQWLYSDQADLLDQALDSLRAYPSIIPSIK